MRRRDFWIELIRAVERESETVAFGLELLAVELRRDPSSLVGRQLEFQDFSSALAHREPTYLVRMFAVFENGLREAWLHEENETTEPRMTDLLDAFAARRGILDEIRQNAHRVRRLRNSYVHDETEEADIFPLTECRRYLCRFFSYLPPDWVVP